VRADAGAAHGRHYSRKALYRPIPETPKSVIYRLFEVRRLTQLLKILSENYSMARLCPCPKVESASTPSFFIQMM
jgi:hypothetical protein